MQQSHLTLIHSTNLPFEASATENPPEICACLLACRKKDCCKKYKKGKRCKSCPEK